MKGGEFRALAPLACVTLALLLPDAAHAGFTARAAATGTFRAAASFGPRNVVPPSVSGAPIAGVRLTASPGVWEPAGTTVALAWQVETAGVFATVATTSAYTLKASEVGKRIRLAVTGAETTVTTAPQVIEPAVRPVNTAPPTISGDLRSGSTLTATTGDWTNVPTSFSREWQRCNGTSCTAVAGRTGPTYVLSTADIGYELRHRVTASNLAGTATVPSANAPVPPSPTAPATLTGLAFTSARLDLEASWWNLHPTFPATVSGSWSRCPGPSEAGCVQIAASDPNSYTPVAADVGMYIRARRRTTQNYVTGEAAAPQVIGPIVQLPPRLSAAVTTNVPNAPAGASAADGSLSTVWNPPIAQRAGDWLRLDFGSVKTLAAYESTTQMGSAGVYEISTDGSTWTSIPQDPWWRFDPGPGVAFEPGTTARFLRMRLTTTSLGTWWVNDIRVWGS